ncbi:MAG TPA: hypothetical protein DEB24_03585 [Coriobacteriia bacterium]|nr:hypothetical protein [Coriobacteriia bacterium]
MVTVVDVAGLLARYSNLIRIASYTDRTINFLGNNSGLLRNQLGEIMHGVATSFLLTIRDYAKTSSEKEARKIARELVKHQQDELDTGTVMMILGITDPVADEDHLHPRGFRVVSTISMLDEAATARIISEYGSLSAIVNDSDVGFDRLDNAGVGNIRAVAASFRQMRNTLQNKGPL